MINGVRAEAYEVSMEPQAPTPEDRLRTERELGTVHEYDTVERDLARSGIRVSRFPLEAGALWRLELPRGERVEAWEPGNDGLTPPSEIATMIESVAPSSQLVPMPPQSDDPGARRLHEMLEIQRRALLRHDPGTRLGDDPENLHQHRVAARRIRTFIRATRAYTDPGWQRSLVEPLRELGAVTGAVRDLDVLLEQLYEEPLEEPDRAHGDVLREWLSAERESARQTLITALGSDSYRLLLTRLRLPPRLGEGVDAVPLRRIARKEFSRLLATVEKLGKHPDDAALHRLRIELKRARYAAELAAAPGAEGRRFLADAKSLQTLLGEHQDAVVAAELLRRAIAGLDGGAAFVAGRLAERRRFRRAKLKKKLPVAWKRLRKSGRRLH